MNQTSHFKTEGLFEITPTVPSNFGVNHLTKYAQNKSVFLELFELNSMKNKSYVKVGLTKYEFTKFSYN